MYTVCVWHCLDKTLTQHFYNVWPAAEFRFRYVTTSSKVHVNGQPQVQDYVDICPLLVAT